MFGLESDSLSSLNDPPAGRSFIRLGLFLSSICYGLLSNEYKQVNDPINTILQKEPFFLKVFLFLCTFPVYFQHPAEYTSRLLLSLP